MYAVTLSEARRDLDRLMERAVEDVEPTIIVSEAGLRIVLLSLEEYNSWKETLYLLSNPANSAHLLKSIAHAEAGEFQERELLDP